MHEVPPEWIAEAGLDLDGERANSYRCEVAHVLIAVSDIEIPLRNKGVVLDKNGFRKDRMLRILQGINKQTALPPVFLEASDPGQRPYRLRDGFHRFYASIAARFSHVPADIVERLD